MKSSRFKYQRTDDLRRKAMEKSFKLNSSECTSFSDLVDQLREKQMKNEVFKENAIYYMREILKILYQPHIDSDIPVFDTDIQITVS